MHESADKKIFNLKNYQSIHIANYHSLNLNLNLKFKNYKNEIFHASNFLRLF